MKTETFSTDMFTYTNKTFIGEISTIRRVSQKIRLVNPKTKGGCYFTFQKSRVDPREGELISWEYLSDCERYRMYILND